MLNLDVSKTVPRTTLAYLTALVPGIFFEVSILLATPQIIATHLATARQTVVLNPYLQLAIAMFIAFMIGNASMLFVSVIQHTLSRLIPLQTILEEEVTRLLLPALSWLHQRHFFAIRPRFHDFYMRRLNSLSYRPGEQEAYRAWTKLARKLLLDRYGVKVEDLNEEWEYFFLCVGTMSDKEWRGPLLVLASSASGWCGLVAALLGPALRNPYYLSLCGILIVTGLHETYYVARRRANPVAAAVVRFRALLREYEKDSSPKNAAEDGPDARPSE